MMKTEAHRQRLEGVGVNHVVEIRHLAVLVADQGEVQRRALGLGDVALPSCRVTRPESTDRPMSFVLRRSNSALRAAKAPSSVVQTGVKSFGCENKMPQLSPSHSWKLMVPSVVSAGEVRGHVAESNRHVMFSLVVRIVRANSDDMAMLAAVARFPQIPSRFSHVSTHRRRRPVQD